MTEKMFRKEVAIFQRLGKVLDKNVYAKSKIRGVIAIIAGIILCIISFELMPSITKASKRLLWNGDVGVDDIVSFNITCTLVILGGVIMIVSGVFTFIISNNIINCSYTCPDCGGLYWYGDTSCHFCKKILTEKQSNTNVQFEQSVKKTKICPYCNKELLQDNVFCSGCGKKLS